ncbi:MAG TPA: hypothetical protein PKW45_18345 [Bryobacteraceae bacterium]|nr:hypothetical protein [Bryobacteraceae bacterium]
MDTSLRKLGKTLGGYGVDDSAAGLAEAFTELTRDDNLDLQEAA